MPTSATFNGQTTQVNTDGGPVIGRDVNLDKGDFVGRGKIEHHHHYHDGVQPPSPTTQRGIFGLYPFNEHFFGRDDELATLHTLLQTESNVSICPVITGMGGLGKTQLAAHYARRHVDDYPDGIFWITAANLNDIRPQLADFCVALGLPVADPQRNGDLTEQKITAFKHYFDNHPHALLLFDNVKEPDHLRTRQIGIGVTALTLGCKVIVTTRRRKLPGDKFAELALQRLLPASARQIITTARPDLAADLDLDRLCDQFGYLPLMLNLAATALKKRGGAIAGYLQRLQALGAEKLHGAVAKVSLDDYHKSLTTVLHEQCAMLRDDNARLLLRVAGQMPEAAAILTASLGLLAGLADVDEWECPLSDALDELEGASLMERVDRDTVRLHPLVRDFAESLIDVAIRSDFRTQCAQRLAIAYTDVCRLGREYAARGISALILDLIVAIDLCPKTGGSDLPLAANPQSPVSSLQSLLRLLRLETHHLQVPPASRRPKQLWQQLLLRTSSTATQSLNQQLIDSLRQTLYWLPLWGHQRQSVAVEQTLSGHADSINAVVVLDAQHIVSASDDYTLKVWNLHTGKVKQTLSSHKGQVTAVAVLDAQHIVSASSDYTLKVWNLHTGKVKQTLSSHKGQVTAVAVLDAQHIVSASFDRTLKVWNLHTGKVEQTLSSHESWVTAVAVLDAQHIVSASFDGTLKVWNLHTDKVEQTLFHESWANAVAVLDEQHIVSASADHTIKVWNLRTGKVEETLSSHKLSVYGVVVLNGQRIVSASDDRTLKAWNLQMGREIASIGLHGALQCVAVAQQGERILVAAGDAAGALYCLELVEPLVSAA